MSNPFFDAPPAILSGESFEPDPLLGRRLAVVGPPVPPGTAAPPDQPVLARQPVQRDALLWVVSLHGGCGASSVTAVLGDDVFESERAWPTSRTLMPQVLLVARTHVVGLTAAENALQEWAALQVPDLHLLGLILVDDAPAVPRALRPALDRVLHASPRGWHLPWQEAWRYRPTTDRPLTYAARRTLGDVRRHALAEGVRTGDNPLLETPVHVEQPTSSRAWRPRRRTRN